MKNNFVRILSIILPFFLISCKISQPANNEIMLSSNDKKEVLGLKEYLLSYKVKNGNWPNDLKAGGVYAQNFQKLNHKVSNDTIKVEYRIVKDLSDSTRIQSLEGRFNMFVKEVLFIKNFPIIVELKDGKTLIDRNNIKNQ